LARLLGTWNTGRGGLADKLAGGLKNLIRTGRLPAGSRLPSERQFASVLGLARTTVGAAFSALRDDGTLSSRTGVGTFVSSSGMTALARGDARLQSFLEHRLHGRLDLRSAAVHALPMVPEELGKLSPEDFLPLADTHGYLPEGLPILRQAIAAYYCDDGLPTDPEEVLVTAGAQQAVHIMANNSLEAGDTVLIEEPTYRGGIESLRAAGARLIAVPSGDDGIDLDQFRDAILRHRPKIALILSTVHNPTGASLTNDKRALIGSLAEENGVTLIDDASTTDTLKHRDRPFPLAYYSARTITIGSASKLFWGGLRIGWIRADRHLLASLVATKGAEDLGTSIPSQVATSRLLKRTAEAREHRRRLLEQAREEALSELATLLPEWHVHPTQGGASLWIRLPAGFSATAFAEQAKNAGVDILAGPTFSTNNGCDDHLRIAFSAPRDVVLDGLTRLAGVWAHWKR
jgi:DNA-binding transcriptional MocR family regulator